jgi:hypothetical protein
LLRILQGATGQVGIEAGAHMDVGTAGTDDAGHAQAPCRTLGRRTIRVHPVRQHQVRLEPAHPRHQRAARHPAVGGARQTRQRRIGEGLHVHAVQRVVLADLTAQEAARRQARNAGIARLLEEHAHLRELRQRACGLMDVAAPRLVVGHGQHRGDEGNPGHHQSL